MIGLIQRVKQAEVIISGKSIAKIDAGMLVFIGIQKNDSEENAHKLQQKLLNYRLFPDQNNKMNVNICQFGGEILLVSQFTLAANTQKGNRPGFDLAMPPDLAKPMFKTFCADLERLYPKVKHGIFGADMQVSLIRGFPLRCFQREAPPKMMDQ